MLETRKADHPRVAARSMLRVQRIRTRPDEVFSPIRVVGAALSCDSQSERVCLSAVMMLFDLR